MQLMPCMYVCRYGMIEAISHLIHRDYEAIVQDFITLRFIPRGEVSLGLPKCPLSFMPHSCQVGWYVCATATHTSAGLQALI